MRATRGRTFTETGRRAQIVAAAVETIAEVGYQQASFAKIAKKAGLSSTGMISYHFTGKEDLVRAVAEDVVATVTAFMRERIEAAVGRAARLRAYVESNIEVVGAHPAHVRALLSILAGERSGADTSVLTERVGRLEAELRDGQRAGEFGDFDPAVMALAITGAIDALVTSLCREPATDASLTHSAKELADLLLRAAGARGSAS
ncbi:TetR/AcrR family transcriptional regulator [Saccharothrix variisporea]|uniref:TetR family transcriptional regulator n=1 Tax=Saccharothrix variisporea TaxID=543527 RepID=A0A495WZR4_9PSEU|nr:TetR/AcrR family transcriptional regulator [Saccharothrix variisporea]RKT66869.1 TetR family transcriptional regulator [Saccharothrix variisporea]